MTRPLFYSSEVTGKDADQAVKLDTSASRHAIRSQRLSTGDEVLVSDGAGTLAQGVIESADPQNANIRIRTITVEERPKFQVNLVQALAKGDRDLLAAEMATETGIDSVTPWQAARSIVRLKAERASKTLAKWEARLQAAAQQARRAYIPSLRAPVVTDQIAELHDPAKGHYVVVLHEDGQTTIAEVATSLENIDTIHLVVGPEGGVAAQELDAVLAAGGSAVRIGNNVMRASTAGPIAIALVNQHFNRW